MPGYGVAFTPVSAVLRFREAIRRSIPPKVTTSWAQAQLGAATVKTAQNRVGELKRLGLVDEEGQVTEAALKLRTEESFAEGCQLVLRSGFPAELIDAFDGHTADEKKVVSVIIGKGEALARQAASLFVFLQRGQPAEAKPSRSASSPRSSKPSLNSEPMPSSRQVAGEQDALDGSGSSLERSSTIIPASITETLRYWMDDGRIAELRFPKDISKAEMRRLMKHIKLDLEDVEEQTD